MNEELKDQASSKPVAESDKTGVVIPKKQRASLTKMLPNDRIAFDKQVSIMRAFAAVYASNGGKPVTNDQAGQALTPPMAGGTVVMSNAFMTDVGLLRRADDGGFSPCDELISYNASMQWDEMDARRKLRPFFEKQWFFRSLQPRLALNPLPLQTCIGTLAGDSGASSEHEARLQIVIKFLELATLIKNEAGTITLISAGAGESKPLPAKPDGQQHAHGQDKDTHTVHLPLKGGRKITVTAPTNLDSNEIKRVQMWIEVTLQEDWSESSKT